MEFCKAPTLQLKALNKHSITHILYIEMENVISIFFFLNTHKKTLSAKSALCILQKMVFCK